MKTKFYFYRLTDNGSKGSGIKAVIEEIAKKDLVDRSERFSGSNDVNRLEYMENKGNWFYCDFTKLRMEHGPGKATADSESKSIDIEPDEGFSESTAVLFDTSNNCAIIQYNHYGMRPESILKYVNRTAAALDSNFEMHPIIERNVFNHAINKSIYRRLQFRIDTKYADQADLKLDLAAGDALRMGNRTGADTVEVIVKASSKKGATLENMKAELGWLINTIQGKKAPMIDMAKLKTKNQIDETLEPIDLLEQRIHTVAEITPNLADKRLPRDARFEALTDAREYHKQYVEQP